MKSWRSDFDSNCCRAVVQLTTSTLFQNKGSSTRQLIRMIPVNGLSDHLQAFQNGGGLFLFSRLVISVQNQIDSGQQFRKRLHLHKASSPQRSWSHPQNFEPRDCPRWLTGQFENMGTLHEISKDADVDLFSCLLQGVPTGFTATSLHQNVFQWRRTTSKPPSNLEHPHGPSSDRSELISSSSPKKFRSTGETLIKEAQRRWLKGVAIGLLGYWTSARMKLYFFRIEKKWTPPLVSLCFSPGVSVLLSQTVITRSYHRLGQTAALSSRTQLRLLLSFGSTVSFSFAACLWSLEAGHLSDIGLGATFVCLHRLAVGNIDIGRGSSVRKKMGFVGGVVLFKNGCRQCGTSAVLPSMQTPMRSHSAH